MAETEQRLIDRPVAIQVEDDNVVHIVQAGTDKQVPVSLLAKYILQESPYGTVVEYVNQSYNYNINIPRQLKLVWYTSGTWSLHLPDIKNAGDVTSQSVHAFNAQSSGTVTVFIGGKEVAILPPGCDALFMTARVAPSSFEWLGTWHYSATPQALTPAQYNARGRLQSNAPLEDSDVVTLRELKSEILDRKQNDVAISGELKGELKNETLDREQADKALNDTIKTIYESITNVGLIMKLLKGFNTVLPYFGSGVEKNTVYVSASGTIEINGKLYPTQSATFHPQSFGTYYVQFSISGEYAVPSFTTSTGSRKDDLNGWYNGNSRVLQNSFVVSSWVQIANPAVAGYVDVTLYAGIKYRVVLSGGGGGGADGGGASIGDNYSAYGGYLDHQFTVSATITGRLSRGQGGGQASPYTRGIGGVTGYNYITGNHAGWSGVSNNNSRTPESSTGRSINALEQVPVIGGYGGRSGGYSGHGGSGGAFGNGGNGFYQGPSSKYSGCGAGAGAASYLFLSNTLNDRTSGTLYSAGGGGGQGGDEKGQDSNDEPGGPGRNNINGAYGGGAPGGAHNARGGDGNATLYRI
jgi:hypothetical protein